MQLNIHFSADIPDRVAEALLATAGPEVDPADAPLAMALVVIQPFVPQIRELLLTEGHEPVPFDKPTLMTTERSAITVALTLTTNDKNHPAWTRTKPQPGSSKTRPKKRPDGQAAAPSRSPSKSKSRRRRGRRTSKG
jgi:hypothetical protein